VGMNQELASQFDKELNLFDVDVCELQATGNENFDLCFS
jgi:hypothetical protein